MRNAGVPVSGNYSSVNSQFIYRHLFHELTCWCKGHMSNLKSKKRGVGYHHPNRLFANLCTGSNRYGGRDIRSASRSFDPLTSKLDAAMNEIFLTMSPSEAANEEFNQAHGIRLRANVWSTVRSSTIQVAGRFDVLLGRGKSHANHPGNQRFQRECQMSFMCTIFRTNLTRYCVFPHFQRSSNPTTQSTLTLRQRRKGSERS